MWQERNPSAFASLGQPALVLDALVHIIGVLGVLRHTLTISTTRSNNIFQRCCTGNQWKSQAIRTPVAHISQGQSCSIRAAGPERRQSRDTPCITPCILGWHNYPQKQSFNLWNNRFVSIYMQDIHSSSPQCSWVSCKHVLKQTACVFTIVYHHCVCLIFWMLFSLRLWAWQVRLGSSTLLVLRQLVAWSAVTPRATHGDQMATTWGQMFCIMSAGCAHEGLGQCVPSLHCSWYSINPEAGFQFSMLKNTQVCSWGDHLHIQFHTIHNILEQ